ncbi:hypothetical protein SAMN03159293_03871, partial [Pseudomonas sp. NFACC39-1]
SIPYYSGRQPGDHLYIVFEGLDASNTPTGFDDNAYVGSEADGDPVLRNVNKAEIKKLDGGSLTVYYWINSQRKSLELLLSVGSGQPEMEKPDVIEAGSNDVLDPDRVNPNVGANVSAPYTGTVPGDIIGLRWRGSRVSAPADERPLNSSSAGAPVPFTVPYRYVIDNLNGTVDVDYYLKRGSEPLRYSRVRPLTIGAAMNLTAPSVKEAGGTAPNQQLNPVAGKDNLTVVIPDYGVQPGDQVSVTWAGTAGDGSYTTPVQILPPNREITMPVSVIAYNLGKPVTVTYTVTRGSESPPSDSLNLAVQAMPVASLTIPLIRQAAQGGIGTELDLNKFTGHASVSVAPWPLIAAGQRVWLKCEGTAASNGSNFTITLYAGSEVSSSQVTGGLSRPLLRSELERLRDGSALKIVLLVAFNGTNNQSEAITFPLRTYTIRKAPIVITENFDAQTTRLIAVGETIDTPSMTIRFVAGDGTAGIAPLTDASPGDNPAYQPVPGKREGQLLHMHYKSTGTAGQRLRLDLKSVYSRVSFWYFWSDKTHQVHCYDRNDQLLDSKSPPSPTKGDSVLIEFAASGIARIDFQVIGGMDWLAMDFFTFTP